MDAQTKKIDAENVGLLVRRALDGNSIPAITVIEISDGEIVKVTAFAATSDGINQAHRHFQAVCLGRGLEVTPDETVAHMELGKWRLQLVNSEL